MHLYVTIVGVKMDVTEPNSSIAWNACINENKDSI